MEDRPDLLEAVASRHCQRPERPQHRKLVEERQRVINEFPVEADSTPARHRQELIAQQFLHEAEHRPVLRVEAMPTEVKSEVAIPEGP